MASLASLAGGAASAAVAGVLSSHPVALLHRGAFGLAPKTPAWGQTYVTYGGSACRRLPAVASTPAPGGGNGGPTTNITAATTISTTATATDVTQFASGAGMAGALPWKVQWQLQVSTTMELISQNSNNGGSATTGTGDPQQQAQFAWTPFDRAESVRRAALEASGWDVELFNARLADLAAVLPDLPRVLPTLPPAQLVAAMSDTHATAAKVVMLKAALPSTNVGMLLLLHPPFLDPACGPERVLAGVEHAARVLGGAAVAEEVLQWYPPLMDPDILDASVAQLRRLVPQLARKCLPSGLGGGTDARQLVHLLGIVMQREGSGFKGAEDAEGGSLWWGCS